MKRIYLYLTFGALLAVTACVDEYTDAQRPELLDGPQAIVTAPSNTISDRRATATAWEATPVVYGLKTETMVFTVDIPDAPGVLDQVVLTKSDTFSSNSVVAVGFDEIKGSTSGSFQVVYTPHPNNAGATYDDAVITLTITVLDKQGASSGAQTVRVRGIACLPSKSISQWYRATASGQVLIGADLVPYTDLKTFQRVQVRFNSTNGTWENASTVFIPDITFGAWEKRNLAPATGRFEFCGGGTLTALRSSSTANANLLSAVTWPTYTGTINEDGTISLTWAHSSGSNGTVTLVPDGF
jgi:hypothetical protein